MMKADDTKQDHVEWWQVINGSKSLMLWQFFKLGAISSRTSLAWYRVNRTTYGIKHVVHKSLLLNSFSLWRKTGTLVVCNAQLRQLVNLRFTDVFKVEWEVSPGPIEIKSMWIRRDLGAYGWGYEEEYKIASSNPFPYFCTSQGSLIPWLYRIAHIPLLQVLPACSVPLD